MCEVSFIFLTFTENCRLFFAVRDETSGVSTFVALRILELALKHTAGLLTWAIDTVRDMVYVVTKR